MDGPGATADPAPSDWDDRLHAHGYRVTPQRALVLAAVNDLGHATPEEILVRVQGESPRVNLHIHLVCRECAGIDSIPAGIARDFLDELERERGFVTDVGHMAIHGVCRTCREGVSRP
jgi:Fur family ferric uptake transcriptional regulator